MNQYIKIILAVVFLFGSFSCNRDEVFEKEQYKNVFALVSGTDNVSTWVHDLRSDESTGYIAASLGGTNPSTKDIRIRLAEDPGLIDAYNVNAFDVNTSKFIRPLSKNKYTIDSYDFTIPAGETRAFIPVKVRPGGLSPDSAYFIAMKVDEYSSYEVNPDKDFVLYRVETRNWWSEYGGTSYNQRGSRLELGSSGNPLQVFGSKRLFPLTPNTVRAMVGTELNDNSAVHIYKWYSVVLTIGNDNKVTISPYANVEVTQMDDDPDYPNVVVLEKERNKTYKTFLLCYSYKASDGKTYVMKEELRLEYKEEPNNPRFF